MDEKLMPCPFCRSVRIVAGREGELFKITCSDCGGSICAPEPNARQRATVWWDSPLEDTARAAGYAAGIADAEKVALDYTAREDDYPSAVARDFYESAVVDAVSDIAESIRALSTSKGE